jgi:hypothetical protein
LARRPISAFRGACNHVAAPALADQDDLSEVAALDLGHDVVDRVREPESGAIVAVGEAGQGDRDGRITGLAQPPGDRLPGPASLPGSGDEDEGG